MPWYTVGSRGTLNVRIFYQCFFKSVDFITKSAVRYNKSAPQLSSQAKQQLLSYSWPGNVRELSHTLERATLLAGDEILPEHLMLVETATSQATAELAPVEASFDDAMTKG